MLRLLIVGLLFVAFITYSDVECRALLTKSRSAAIGKGFDRRFKSGPPSADLAKKRSPLGFGSEFDSTPFGLRSLDTLPSYSFPYDFYGSGYPYFSSYSSLYSPYHPSFYVSGLPLGTSYIDLAGYEGIFTKSGGKGFGAGVAGSAFPKVAADGSLNFTDIQGNPCVYKMMNDTETGKTYIMVTCEQKSFKDLFGKAGPGVLGGGFGPSFFGGTNFTVYTDELSTSTAAVPPPETPPSSNGGVPEDTTAKPPEEVGNRLSDEIFNKPPN